MTLVEVNWKPTGRQLRQFGVISLVALPLLGWLWGGGAQVVAALAAVGLAIAVIGLAVPAAIRPVYLAMTLVAVPIGIVLGELAMLLIYFGLFLPIGLVFRLVRRDALERKLDRSAPSYWRLKKQPRGPASYFRQS